MLLALAAYENRIASVFESLDRFFLADFNEHRCEVVSEIKIVDSDITHLMGILKNYEAEILICGAINRCLRQLIERQSIRVIPWVKGDVAHVMHAFTHNNLASDDFIMPGCRRRGRGRQNRKSGHGGNVYFKRST